MSSTYTVLRSSRKTMALELTRDLQILVRAPHSLSHETIAHFVSSHSEWIERQSVRIRENTLRHPEPSPAQVEFYRQKAKDYIPDRVADYSQRMQLHPAAITITGAKTRFGSCSGSNRLSFSWRLMQYPIEAIDYVIVHELAHITHKNHGSDFYALIATQLPDWKQRRQLLK